MKVFGGKAIKTNQIKPNYAPYQRKPKGELVKAIANNFNWDLFGYQYMMITAWSERSGIMNNDLISRKALLKELGEEPLSWNDTDSEIQKVSDYRAFKSLVENALAVDTERHGTWIKKNFKIEREIREFTICDQCGQSRVAGLGLAKFCPNCGCRMDGDTE